MRCSLAFHIFHAKGRVGNVLRARCSHAKLLLIVLFLCTWRSYYGLSSDAGGSALSHNGRNGGCSVSPFFKSHCDGQYPCSFYYLPCVMSITASPMTKT